MAEIKPNIETVARILVVGVGGSGGHVIDRMMEMKMSGVDFVAVNTDSQDLHHNKAPEKIHIGKNLTKGLGAGMNPEIGRQAAEENRDEIQEVLKDAEMIFVTCGMGGGTGTGAAPIVAEVAKESGALTVGVVTKPFSFEGTQRALLAEEGLENLKDRVDTLITIPNDKLLQVIDKKTSLLNAFGIVDDVLRQGVQGISDLITIPGMVNVDFADVRAVMKDAGSALMGIGKASGENRAVEAARQAINSPLLDLSIDGAKGVLFNVGGDPEMGMLEIQEVAKTITEKIDSNAKVIFGAVANQNDEAAKNGELKVTVIATGFETDEEGDVLKEKKPQRKSRSRPSSQNIPVSGQQPQQESGLPSPPQFPFGDIDTGIHPSSPGQSSSQQDSNYPGSGSQSPQQPQTPYGSGYNQNDQNQDDDDDDDDELEIPAFIRKKMK
ncbi:MAG: cell division protein FtsZ [Candidatus Moranbacteria bacterium]|nr:cell division protein FtsZ [Candidatus Moranbacteria bacterium]